MGDVFVNWVGDKPEIGNVYEIELDIDGILIWGKDVTLSNDVSFSIEFNENFTFLYGILESVDSDGYAVLRMDDSIISFLTQGDPFDIGSSIKISTGLISAYPVYY